MSSFSIRQLTFGTPEGQTHSHSYYDISVLDDAASRVLVHRMSFAERQPEPSDTVRVGIVDVADGRWTDIGETSAWSWQQGPMAQWIGGGERFAFNARDGERFIARVFDASGRDAATLGRPLYAVAPDASFGLGLNMARLDALRPGYGYAGGSESFMDNRHPEEDGVWKLTLDGDGEELILSLRDAVRFLLAHLPLKQRLEHAVRRYHYWFNHAKISPNGQRFTVKLRWRKPGGPWNGTQGVSLTCGTDGTDVRLLADATSHVLWLNDRQLYFWRAGELALFDDTCPRGTRRGVIAPELIKKNVHVRHLPPGPLDRLGEMVLDTPYQETVDLLLHDEENGETETIDRFEGHRPARGPFRCDLHPAPSKDGNAIIITSLRDGGRQVYLATRGG
ncbi:hypothetical protein HK107_11030 [Parvularcula sp. ZS-1/3]|uniref:Uncharacterized protein n=1 Tax=Parvularcula mediterranea TaxID=2732508 RepID=A0A7Y3W622_9PROT|nr:hypothetical protein [Parvularcula mediterranea]NNU16851.1 hypothetical protein [Parvularcula mediterranea]